jgi:hypothetical protein
MLLEGVQGREDVIQNSNMHDLVSSDQERLCTELVFNEEGVTPAVLVIAE